jgi:hyperosmotically inducible periplasmic protein
MTHSNGRLFQALTRVNAQTRNSAIQRRKVGLSVAAMGGSSYIRGAWARSSSIPGQPPARRAAGGSMKKLILSAIVAMSPLCIASQALADEPGANAKNSVITAKVKTKLAAKHMSTLTNIKVETDSEGVVWLSGKAATQDASDLASMIAKDTDGVRSVHNKIVIAP